jgi:hypothetical protein
MQNAVVHEPEIQPVLLSVQHFIRVTVLEISRSVSSHAEMECTIFPSNMRVVKIHKIFSRLWETFFNNERLTLYIHNAYAIGITSVKVLKPDLWESWRVA